MSSDLETLKHHTSELHAALNRIRDSAAGIARFRTELEQALHVLRQANQATEPLRHQRRRSALGWALLGGFLGGLVAAWVTLAFLGE